MTHSILTHRGRHESFNDLDLIAFICLAGAAAEQPALRLRNASLLLSEWKNRLAHYGPGTIDLPLEIISASSKLSEEFHFILHVLEKQSEAFGTTIPSALLNESCPAPNVRFGEFPTSALLSTIERLRALIT